MSGVRTLAAAALIALLCAASARAARPIVDLHKLDAYFALFATDSNVPWKPTSVRLDTYSSAPVQFSVYRVDPADVLTAGSNARPRAVDTRRLRPIARFTFTPPGGYQFQSNQVDVPLGDAQGFFVVEARRANVGEQVWINRTRVGLIAERTPDELFLHGVDLGTGKALAEMRVQLLVNDRFVTRYTGSDGSLIWRGADQPIFVLAQWGDSVAFLSPLPVAPVPSTVVGVRTASAVVHGGGVVRVIGFARVHRDGVFVPASGYAEISLRDGARVLDHARVDVDRSGAFSTDLRVPPDANAGDDAILAQVGDGVGGASVHVDADAGGLSLDVASACGDDCSAEDDVPVIVRSSRPDTDVLVSVVRSPHVYVGYTPETTPWGTTMWYEQRVRTDDRGVAEIRIPRPTDGLASTYGVRAESGGATADTRIVVPTAPVTIRLDVDRDRVAIGTPVGFDVYANDVQNGSPAHGRVTVTLSHGGAEQSETLLLDDAGRARGAFHNADLGTNLMIASYDDGSQRALDATQLEVGAQADGQTLQANSENVTLTLGADGFRPGESIEVDADAPGAAGQAVVMLSGAFGVQADVARVADGRAHASLRAVDAPGALQVAVAFVRDGAVETASLPVDIDGRGRGAVATLRLVPPAQPSLPAVISLGGVYATPGTVAVRFAKGDPSGSALFTTAPGLLEFGVSTTQTSAPESVTWHPWVDATGAHPLVLNFVRRTEQPPDLTIEQSDTSTVDWTVRHVDGNDVPVDLPAEPGRYTLSVLDVTDDGRVIVASSIVNVP
jgi:hypothetical protein